MGPPTRIVQSQQPSPGDRFHVYDLDGIYFIEHSATHAIEGCCIVFQPAEHRHPATPTLAFNGVLHMPGYTVAQEQPPELAPLLQQCRIPLQHLGMRFGATHGDFAITGMAVASKSGSEPNSSIRLVELSLSWPSA